MNGIEINHLSVVEHHRKFLLLSLQLGDFVVVFARLVLRRLDLAPQLRQLAMERALRHRLGVTKSKGNCYGAPYDLVGLQNK